MDDKQDTCKKTEEQRSVATGFAGHEPDQFSSEGYEKAGHSDDELGQCEKTKNLPDSEGRVDKLSGQSGEDRQSKFVDDKEYLASSGGGRSFQYADELTNEDEKAADSVASKES